MKKLNIVLDESLLDDPCINMLDNLPMHEGRSYYLNKRDIWAYHYRFNWATFDIVRHVIKKFMGKSFDDAFSYYCKKVRKDDQRLFMEKFNETAHHNYQSDYIIDNNGNIQENPDKFKWPKKEISVKSDDYSIRYRLKIENLTFNQISRTPKDISESDYSNFYTYGHYIPYLTKKYGVTKDDYEPYISSGSIKIYESRHDREYIRLTRERIKASKRKSRTLEKQLKSREYSFLTKEELQRKFDNNDTIKRDKHGFDKYSFIGPNK